MLGHLDACSVSRGPLVLALLSSRREPLLARAPLRTGDASWPRVRLKHGLSPLVREPAPDYRVREDSCSRYEIDVDR